MLKVQPDIQDQLEPSEIPVQTDQPDHLARREALAFLVRPAQLGQQELSVKPVQMVLLVQVAQLAPSEGPVRLVQREPLVARVLRASRGRQVQRVRQGQQGGPVLLVQPVEPEQQARPE